jgi:hypothetical protein
MKPAKGTLVVSHYDPSTARRRTLIIASIWLASLVALYLFCKTTMTPGYIQTQAQLKQAQTQIVTLEGDMNGLRDRLAQAERGLQVSDEAKAALQRDLESRTDEMNAMRADLSFFQKFAGGGNADALGVQEVLIQSTPDARSYKYRFSLSQNLKRGTMVRGRVSFSVSGLQAGKPKRLDMKELVGDAAATDGQSYEFKYFQIFSGTIFLPEGFTPSTIKIRMKNEGGESAEKEIDWRAALDSAPTAQHQMPVATQSLRVG